MEGAAGEEIGAALHAIAEEAAEERRLARYQAALKVLREIPSGTPDSDLTLEQKQAWEDLERYSSARARI